MQAYPSNSNEPREPRKLHPVEDDEKVVKKITKGGVIHRKPSLGKRIKAMFIGEDSGNVFEYIIEEVMVPALKDLIVDSFKEGMERKFYGNNRPTRRSSSRTNTFGTVSHTSYNRFSNPRREERTQSRRSFDLGDVILETRSDAMDTLEELRKSIARYEFVTVGTLYDLIGEQSHHTDEKWGWTDLDNASVRHTASGYILNLPRPEPIE